MRHLTSLTVAATTAAALLVSTPAIQPVAVAATPASSTPQSSNSDMTTPVLVIVGVLAGVVAADLLFNYINASHYRTLFSQSSTRA